MYKIEILRKADSEDGAAKPSEVRSATTQRKLRALLASARSAQNNINEIAGGLGSEIKTAVEKDFLHRKAFNVCKQADRMEPEKLRDFLDCLDHYLDISGLRDRASKVQPLDLRDPEENDDDEGDEPAKTRGRKKAKPFPNPKGEASE